MSVLATRFTLPEPIRFNPQDARLEVVLLNADATDATVDLTVYGAEGRLNAPGSRGVVCSASYEARQFGVRSAMPIARAVRLCPQAMCVPVPRGACGRKSREISTVLHRFAPVVQAASIDEWYLDLSGTEALYRGASLAEVAHQIRDAVHADLAQSREVYNWVTGLCLLLGAAAEDMVPFDKYAAAAQGLLKPSSAARALTGGGKDIERIDLLVKLVADQKGLQSDAVDETVRRVNGWLERNRKATASAQRPSPMTPVQ